MGLRRQHVALAPAPAAVLGDEQAVGGGDRDPLRPLGVEVEVDRGGRRRALLEAPAAVGAHEHLLLLDGLAGDDVAAHVERVQVGLAQQRDGRPGRAAVVRADQAEVLGQPGRRVLRMAGGDQLARSREAQDEVRRDRARRAVRRQLAVERLGALRAGLEPEGAEAGAGDQRAVPGIDGQRADERRRAAVARRRDRLGRRGRGRRGAAPRAAGSSPPPQPASSASAGSRTRRAGRRMKRRNLADPPSRPALTPPPARRWRRP